MIVTVEEGLSSAIDEVAEAAEPSRRFLRRAWFQAAVSAFSSAKPMTIVGRRASGRALIAVPVVAIRRHLPFLRTVPGSYWPFRSIAVSHDLGADDLVAFLGDPLARKALGFIWRLGPIATTDPIVSLLRTAAHSGGWYIATKRLAMAYVLDLQQLRQDGGWPRGTTVRKNRAHERHLAEHGALDWIRISGRDWTTGVVEMLAGIEERSWVGVRTDRSESQFLADGNRFILARGYQGPVVRGTSKCTGSESGWQAGGVLVRPQQRSRQVRDCQLLRSRVQSLQSRQDRSISQSHRCDGSGPRPGRPGRRRQRIQGNHRSRGGRGIDRLAAVAQEFGPVHSPTGFGVVTRGQSPERISRRQQTRRAVGRSA